MADRDELLRKASGLFSKLGSQLKDTATVVGSSLKDTATVVGSSLKDAGEVAGAQLRQTAKQVTGLGRGTVRLELDQTRAAPGGTLSGRLVLELSEPVEARRLFVQLRARQKQIAVRRDGGGQPLGGAHAEVYTFTRELGDARSYQSEVVAFELTVPADALELRAASPSSPLGEVVRSVAAAVSAEAGPVEWQVVGGLDVPRGRNLDDHVDVVVG